MSADGDILYRNKIVVLGNQKSGTSAIASLLAKATGLSCQIDVPPFWPPALRRIIESKEECRQLLIDHRNLFQHDVIKEPNFTFAFDRLYPFFAESSWVFIVRHPLDNIRSILDRLRLPGDLRDPSKKVRKLSYLEQAILDPHILNQQYCHYIDVLAERWVLSVSTYLQHSKDFLLCPYELFLADKKGFVHSMAQSLSLPIKAGIDAIVDHQFQNKGTHSGTEDWQGFFGNNLERIQTICEPFLPEFGYVLPDY